MLTAKPSCVFQRHLFFTSQLKNYSSVDAYLTKLKTLSKDCSFGELEDSLIRDRLICCITDGEIKKLIFEMEDPSLDQVVKLMKSTNQEVSFVEAGKRSVYRPPASQAERCKFCNLSHGPNKTSCTAWGKLARHVVDSITSQALLCV